MRLAFLILFATAACADPTYWVCRCDAGGVVLERNAGESEAAVGPVHGSEFVILLPWSEADRPEALLSCVTQGRCARRGEKAIARDLAKRAASMAMSRMREARASLASILADAEAHKNEDHADEIKTAQESLDAATAEWKKAQK